MSFSGGGMGDKTVTISKINDDAAGKVGLLALTTTARKVAVFAFNENTIIATQWTSTVT